MGLGKGPLEVTMERRKAILDLPHFDRRQVQQAYTWFEYRVYRGYRPLYQLFMLVIRNKIKSYAFTNSLYLKLAQIPILDRLRARGERNLNAFNKTK